MSSHNYDRALYEHVFQVGNMPGTSRSTCVSHDALLKHLPRRRLQALQRYDAIYLSETLAIE